MTIFAKLFNICSPKFGDDCTFRLNLVATVTDDFVVLMLLLQLQTRRQLRLETKS